MQKKVIVDYLNFTSIFYLIKNERNSAVIALFKPQSKSLEFIFTKTLGLFGISYFFEEMIFAKLPQNPTTDVINRNKKLARLISKQFYFSSLSKVNDLYNFFISSWIFHNLWRAVSIVEYSGAYYQEINNIYIAAPIKKHLLRKYFEVDNTSNHNLRIHFYSAVGLIDDNKYAYRKVKPKYRFLGEKSCRLVQLLYLISYVSVKVKLDDKKIDALLFSHDKDEHKWMGINKVSDYLNINSQIVLPNQAIGKGKNQFKIDSIHWTVIGKYYSHIFLGVYKYAWALNVSSELFYNLLYVWKYIFILNNLYKDFEVKIVLGGGYESIIVQIAVALASDNNEMLSFDSTASLGEYPTEFSSSWHKFSDRFFLWGSWHYDLSHASKNKSSGCIISGYIYDHNISLMKDDGSVLRNKYSKKYNKIITIFDTTIDNDHAFSGDIVFKYIDTVMKIAEEFNALVVLKTKKGNSLYDNLIKTYGDDKLLIHEKKASLVSALVSDVVIGLSASTPAVISAIYGRKMILFEPTKIVWNNWDNHNYPIVNSLRDLQTAIRELLLDNQPKKKPCSNRFDPYLDGKSQYRIAKYIECVFENLYRGKVEALLQADTEYKLKWGKDKVFLSEELNK